MVGWRIEMELPISEILANAGVFDPQSKMVTEDLRSAVHALFDALDSLQVDYLLVGATEFRAGAGPASLRARPPISSFCRLFRGGPMLT